MADRARAGVNPLPWIFGADQSWNGDEPMIRVASSDRQKVRFRARHAEMSPATLSGYDFVPAPGYFAGNLENHHDDASLVEVGAPNLPDRVEIAHTSFGWVAAHPDLVGSLA